MTALIKLNSIIKLPLLIATSKSVELSYELDYAFFLVVDIMVGISEFHGNIHVPSILSSFFGNIYVL